MPLFVMTCLDKLGARALRNTHREAHLAHIAAQAGRVKLAGPFLDDAGEMIGSLIIIEAPDRAAVEAFRAADPYDRSGLFERVEIRAWRASIGELG